MVFEVKLTGFDKGTGIEAFLDEPPFRGRTPIFIGDDITDEAGFAVVNARNGISIKIGPEQTLARYRAANIDEFQNWLKRLAFARPEEETAI
jgi:trehalose 6-phosphate phosphatase